jgi:phosphate/phosphite/phosphonate ABC transporters, periplasmic binding protein
MKRISFLTVLVLLVSIIAMGCGSSSTTGGKIKEADTVTIAWLPNNSGDDFKEVRAEVGKIIEKATGKKVEDRLTTDYAILIEAIASGNAQIAYCGAQQYIMAHDKNAQVIPLVTYSGDSGTLKDAMYYSRILVQKGNEGQYQSGSGYAIDKLPGKKMSFVSNSSTSGFKVPSATIVSYFSKQDKWKNLKDEDLLEGGSDKFFSQVLFGGSHQLSLVNLLSGKADVAAVDDIDVVNYVELSEGQDNTEGAVYTVKKDAAAPFDKLGGAQFVVIKSIPVMNAPIIVNSGALDRETIDKITAMLTSDEVANNPLIFVPKDSKNKGLGFKQPQRFVKVDDAWYQPIRDLSK